MSRYDDTLASLAEWRKVAEAATPGPWWNDWTEVYGGTYDEPRYDANGDRDWIAETCANSPRDDANGTHIATFDPATMLRLIDGLEAALDAAPNTVEIRCAIIDAILGPESADV